VEPFAELLRQGAANAWFFVPTAILLGALHGLEPGHSKSLMVSFVVAVRGTVPQAALLGVSAALSHSLIVWGLAIGAMALGDELIADNTEPYFMMLSGAIVLAMAAWMLRRQLKAPIPASDDHRHGGHGHGHGHGHGEHGHDHQADIARRFAGRQVGNGEIALFGLSGGLLPCPAAIAVVIICLQIREYALGLGMVGAFSLGLALTLVTVGVLAAWSARHVASRAPWLEDVARKLPYLSVFFVAALGLSALLQGLSGLP